MAKLPDFTKIVEKLDLQTIVDNVKSIINPGSVIPEDGEGDPILTAFIELHKSIKYVAEIQAQQAQEIAKLNNMLAALFNKLKEDKIIDLSPNNDNESENNKKNQTSQMPAEKPSATDDVAVSEKPLAMEKENSTEQPDK